MNSKKINKNTNKSLEHNLIDISSHSNRVHTEVDDFKQNNMIDIKKKDNLPFDLNTIIFEKLSILKNKILRELKKNKIIPSGISKNKIICKKDDLLFEINIIKLIHLEEGYILKFLKKNENNENVSQYKDILKLLINKICN